MVDRTWPSGWRGLVLISLGILMGASAISPAVAHVGGSVTHLWGHLKPKVRSFGDPRWVNATEAAGGDLSGTFADLQINANAVGTTEIVIDAVGSAEIAENAVGSQEISTVFTDDIAPNTIVADDIGTGAVGAAEVNLVLGTPVTSEILPGGAEGNGDAHTASVDAFCPVTPSQEIIGVSVDWSPNPGADDELYVVESLRLGTAGWRVWAGNDTSFDATFTVTALCLG